MLCHLLCRQDLVGLNPTDGRHTPSRSLILNNIGDLRLLDLGWLGELQLPGEPGIPSCDLAEKRQQDKFFQIRRVGGRVHVCGCVDVRLCGHACVQELGVVPPPLCSVTCPPRDALVTPSPHHTYSFNTPYVAPTHPHPHK